MKRFIYLPSSLVEHASTQTFLSEKSKRILALVILPIWFIGLSITIYFSAIAIIEIPKYIKAKNRVDHYQPIFGTYADKISNELAEEAARLNNSLSEEQRENRQEDEEQQSRRRSFLKAALGRGPDEVVQGRNEISLSRQVIIAPEYCEYVDYPEWAKPGVKDDYVLWIMRNRVLGLSSIPIYLFIFFLFPWILIRLFFWVKTAK